MPKWPMASAIESGRQPPSSRCLNQMVSSGMLPYQMRKYCEKPM